MKNSNIRYILAVVMLMATSAAVAQEMQSAYFVKDYLFRHDLNPALGNEKNYISFPALGNVNAVPVPAPAPKLPQPVSDTQTSPAMITRIFFIILIVC